MIDQDIDSAVVEHLAQMVGIVEPGRDGLDLVCGRALGNRGEYGLARFVARGARRATLIDDRGGG